MKYLWIAVTILASVLLLFFFFRSTALFSEEKAAIKVVEVEKVSRNKLVQTIRLIGTIQAKRESVLVAKIDGVLDRTVQAGDRVKKGDLIATLENVALQKNYDLAIHAEMLARQKYDRAMVLSKTNTLSKASLEEQQNLWLTAQRTVSDARIQLDKTRFTAPFDGVVGVFKVREGAQMIANNVLVTIYDPTNLIVAIDIPETILSQVRIGQMVWVDNKSYTLTAVQKIIDPETHMAPASFDFTCENCIIGSNVDVELMTAEKDNILTVPTEAITIRDQKTFVFVVEENKAALRPVKIGLRQKDRQEIEDGLTEGDLVIIRGQKRLYPGLEVAIAKEAEK